jgi:hypothetical protein
LSDNLKLRLDSTSGDTHQDRLSGLPDAVSTADAAPVDDAESQMRKALGLLGEPPRRRPEPDRTDQPSRLGERFNGGLHRRRFVQDGDIPVTVLRRDPGHEAPAPRGAAPVAPPTSSRLQRTEAALANETAAREKAERALAEAQSVVRDLQTKIGHAELTKNEAIETLRHEREAMAELRAERAVWEARLHEAQEQLTVAERTAHACQDQLANERQARIAAEKSQQAAEAARDTAEALVQALSHEPAVAAPVIGEPVRKRADTLRRPVVAAEPKANATPAVTRRSRVIQVASHEPEPEPVKWWLNTKPAGKKR